MSGVFPGDETGICASVGYKPWFPSSGETSHAAKRICGTCPVQTPCLTYALHHPVKGVWGGANESDRGMPEPTEENVA